MLNLSPTSIEGRVHTERYRAFGMLKSRYTGRWARRAFLAFTSVVIAMLFLPWTQNIQSTGRVTVLAPAGRPQEVTVSVTPSATFTLRGATIVGPTEGGEYSRPPRSV